MEILFFVAMMSLLVYVMYRNITLVKRYRHNKEYIECYKEMLAGTETAYERISAYIEEEDSAEFKNKGRVLKLYEQMDTEEDISQTLNDLDLNSLVAEPALFLCYIKPRVVGVRRPVEDERDLCLFALIRIAVGAVIGFLCRTACQCEQHHSASHNDCQYFFHELTLLCF